MGCGAQKNIEPFVYFLSVLEAFFCLMSSAVGFLPLCRNASTTSLSNTAAGTTDAMIPNKANQLNFLLGEEVHILC